MKFSSQEEYGIRCLIQIGKHDAQGGLTIPEISEMESLSESHVGKLARMLRLSGFIESTRGQEGGYRLARPADKILIGEVLGILGGRLYDGEFCEKHTGSEKICNHSIDCSVRSLWQNLQVAVDQILTKITLQDLLGSEQQMVSKIQIPKNFSVHAHD